MKRWMIGVVVVVGLCGCQPQQLIQGAGAPPEAQPTPPTVTVTVDCTTARAELSGFDDADSGFFGYGAAPPVLVKFSSGNYDVTLSHDADTNSQSWSLIVRSADGTELVRRGGQVAC